MDRNPKEESTTKRNIYANVLLPLDATQFQNSYILMNGVKHDLPKTVELHDSFYETNNMQNHLRKIIIQMPTIVFLLSLLMETIHANNKKRQKPLL